MWAETSSLQVFVLLVVLGCGGKTETDGESFNENRAFAGMSDEERRVHRSPDRTGRCPSTEDHVREWSTDLQADGLDDEYVQLAQDPCGNVIVSWNEYGSGEGEGNAYPMLARLFADGDVDWELPLLDPTITSRKDTRIRDLKADEFGNILVLTNRSLQMFTPSGSVHPAMPSGGDLIEGGKLLRGVPEGWLVVAEGLGAYALPSRAPVWQTHGFGLVGAVSTISDLHVLEEAKYLVTLQSFEGVGSPSGVDYIHIVSEWVLSLPDSDGYIRPESRELVKRSSKSRIVGSRVVKAEQQVIHGYSEVESTSRSCVAGRLEVIGDLTWGQEQSFCGILMDLNVTATGEIDSLWVVEEEQETSDRVARALLVRRDAAGGELFTLDLTPSIGVVGYPSSDSSVSVEMVVSEDGQSLLAAGGSTDASLIKIAHVDLN